MKDRTHPGKKLQTIIPKLSKHKGTEKNQLLANTFSVIIHTSTLRPENKTSTYYMQVVKKLYK